MFKSDSTNLCDISRLSFLYLLFQCTLTNPNTQVLLDELNEKGRDVETEKGREDEKEKEKKGEGDREKYGKRG